MLSQIPLNFRSFEVNLLKDSIPDLSSCEKSKEKNGILFNLAASNLQKSGEYNASF
ncbi:MAG: hypothetical protein K9G57_15975 [Ignavibacteriales bacterium]|nr:hypothetical protein [Ignavibacteriales bacterium]